MVPALNTAIVPEFLATRYVAGSETFFKGVRKLLPGRTLTWSAGDRARQRRYWTLPAEIEDSGMEPGEAAQAILRGVARNQALIICPLYGRLGWWCQRHFPWLLSPLWRMTVREWRTLRVGN